MFFNLASILILYFCISTWVKNVNVMIKTLRLFGASTMWRVMLQVYEIIVFNLLLNNLMDVEAQAGCLQNMIKNLK
ncbi:MAG: hypothetical protein IGNPGNKH_00605 [Sodalis sp. Ffu]|nr:MAG: hypothetical protein IGNPGNKH_00605 [Sodalis sp. Ffu]